MASAGLPTTAIQNLPAAFWGTEAQVNAVWLGLLAKSFPGDPGPAGGVSYLIAPEGRPGASTSGRRADLLVSQFIPGAAPTPWATAAVDNILHFEGKGGDATENFDNIRRQVFDWMGARGARLAGGGLKYSIAAKGREWMPFVYDPNAAGGQGNVQFVKMERVTMPAPGHWDITRTDSTQRPFDLFDTITVLAGFLAFVAANPHPPTNNTVIRVV